MNLEVLEIMEKVLNIAHWTFTIILLVIIIFGYWISFIVDTVILLKILAVSFCGMWLCSAVGGNAVGDDYDNYGDG